MKIREEMVERKLSDGLSSEVEKKLFFDNRIVNEWLTTDSAAQYLGVSPNALRIMVYRDQVRYYKFGRRLRFKAEDCRALFKSKGV